MKRILVVAVALTLVLSAAAFAGNNPVAKVAVHVRDHNAKAGCNIGIINGCADIVTTGAPASFSVDAFPIFYDLVEYLGCEYGLCWPAWTYSAAFTSCSDLVIGGIMWPGEGASHTWFVCNANVAVPSFVWLYADGPGQVCVCPHPTSGVINVLDCNEGLDDPILNVCAGVYGDTGGDPCEPVVATDQSTWGGIKSIFE